MQTKDEWHSVQKSLFLRTESPVKRSAIRVLQKALVESSTRYERAFKVKGPNIQFTIFTYVFLTQLQDKCNVGILRLAKKI